MSPTSKLPLRVAYIAGGLTQGGAEKQLVYMARALQRNGIEVRVYCLTKGDYFEEELIRTGIEPVWIGAHPSPLRRIPRLVKEIRKFRPHILQSSHFFTNLYASLAAPLGNAISIGSVRSDPEREVRLNGGWGKWLLHGPSALIANSDSASKKVLAMGVSKDKVYTLPNVIDLAEFDRGARAHSVAMPDASIRVITVARLVPVKRLDRLIKAIALARKTRPDIVGIIVGDGPELETYRSIAAELGLLPDGIRFTGMQANIPSWLTQADIFALTSEQEGFPNVLIEAMAAELPVLSTPAGDARSIVQDGVTGCILEMDDVTGMAEIILKWAADPALRRRMGTSGRRKVELQYSSDSLANQLIDIYRDIAQKHRQISILDSISSLRSIEAK